MIISLILFFAFITLFAPGSPENILPVYPPIDPYYDLWYAVKMVESSGREDVINYQEGAYGIAQIRQCKLNEYNRATNNKYKLRDCFSEEISRKIFYWHCDKYESLELAAKRWNGSGPLTDIYWKKVKKYLPI